MSVLVRYKPETKEKARIVGFHPNPQNLSDKSVWLEQDNVVEVDDDAFEKMRNDKRDAPQDKKAIMYINPETKEMWCDYIDRPDNDPQMMARRIDDLEKATGSGDRGVERGLAHRLDDLEERIEALEKEPE